MMILEFFSISLISFFYLEKFIRDSLENVCLSQTTPPHAFCEV